MRSGMQQGLEHRVLEDRVKNLNFILSVMRSHWGVFSR